jgi:mRNA-degrading endonuclease toxin of MazEF toxin-antitoxin module
VKIGVSLPEDLVAFADEAARLHLVGLPGNVRLSRGDTRLPKASIANVYDVQKVLRPDLMERLGTLPSERVAAIGSGLRLVLDL